MANYSICIGVSDYDSDSNIPKLNYAHKDAQDLHELFQKQLNFQECILLRSHHSEYKQGECKLANYTQIYKQLSKRFNKNRKKPYTLNDNLWFFFSGHGIEHNRKHYLLPCDAAKEEEYLEKTSLALEDIAYSFKEYSGAGNIIMLIDACRERDKRSRSLPTSFLDNEQGIITITSCQSDQLSYEIDKLENGSFTHVLLQCLKPNSEYNSVTVERLVGNLKTYVPIVNAKFNIKGQIPTAKLEPSHKNHLILLPEYSQPSLADIKTLESEALQAQVDGNLETAQVIWRSLVKSYSNKAIDNLIKIGIALDKNQTSIDANQTKISQPSTPKIIEIEKQTNQIKKEEKPKFIIEDLGDGIKLEMVYIPVGEFMMGSNEYDDEKPTHKVTLQEFYMGRYPITQAQYQAVMGENPSYFKGKNNPVDSVSWNMAQKFRQKLSQKTGRNYQLPSESQWEYTCRAGNQGKWCFGDDKSKLKDYAWYDDNANNQTHPVGEKKPNSWGLYDMHGNVWEWCQDDYTDSYENTPRNGESHREKFMQYIVFRGGGYNLRTNYCRSAFRNRDMRSNAYNNNGFRIICFL